MDSSVVVPTVVEVVDSSVIVPTVVVVDGFVVVFPSVVVTTMHKWGFSVSRQLRLLPYEQGSPQLLVVDSQ